MKKFKKEIIAIISGIAFAYTWQLFALLMSRSSSSNSDFITGDMFIPAISIQIAIAPIIAWGLMGLLNVTWFQKWMHITMRVVSVGIPFALISVVTVMMAPSLWGEKIYWVANVGISILLSFSIFKPLKYLFMEQNNLPKEGTH